jgi:hypothetical protein
MSEELIKAKTKQKVYYTHVPKENHTNEINFVDYFEAHVFCCLYFNLEV